MTHHFGIQGVRWDGCFIHLSDMHWGLNFLAVIGIPTQVSLVISVLLAKVVARCRYLPLCIQRHTHELALKDGVTLVILGLLGAEVAVG